MTNVIKLTPKMAECTFSFKSRVDGVNPYITLTVYYNLAVVSCPKNTPSRLKRLLFRFLRKNQVPLVRKSSCYQHPLCGNLEVTSLKVWRHNFRLSHQQKCLNHCDDVDNNDDNKTNRWVCHSCVNAFLQLFLLKGLQSWVRQGWAFGTHCNLPAAQNR